MYQFSGSTQAALDYDSTIIGALEMSEKKWLLAVQLPGVRRYSRHVLGACGDGLVSFVERLKARCAAAGRKIARVILTHEAGRDGFWLARFLAATAITRGVRRGVAPRAPPLALDQGVHDWIVHPGGAQEALVPTHPCRRGRRGRRESGGRSAGPCACSWRAQPILRLRWRVVYEARRR